MKRDKAELGQDAIAAYKSIKGVLQIAGAIVLVVLIAGGLAARFEAWAVAVARQASDAWSMRLAHVVTSAVTPKHVAWATTALGLDGVLSSVEGWSLRRRKWWGPWLVVVATSSLVPFELVALATHPHWGRAALLALNAAIVVFLAQKAAREGGAAPRLRLRSSGGG